MLELEFIIFSIINEIDLLIPDIRWTNFACYIISQLLMFSMSVLTSDDPEIAGQLLPLIIPIESILPAPCLKLWSKGLVKLRG
jgi:hypothetical protein